MHSNKADRRHFLGQLKAAWEHGGRTDVPEWVAINERLRLRRDELNAYVEALHKRYPNGWTPYHALGIALKAADALAPGFSWPERDAHDAQTLRSLEELAAELGLVFASIERQPTLDLVDVVEWSSGWQDSLLAAAQSLRNAIDMLVSSFEGYVAILGLKPRERLSQTEHHALAALATALQKSEGRDITIASDLDFALCAGALDSLGRSINDYREAERGLSASYGASAMRDLDPKDLERQWREANVSFWPSAMLGKRKVQKLLQSYAGSGCADPERDLPLLRRMKECLSAVDQNLLAMKPLPINGLDTDLEAVAKTIELARELLDALRLPDMEQEELRSIGRSVATCLRGTAENDRGTASGGQASRCNPGLGDCGPAFLRHIGP